MPLFKPTRKHLNNQGLLTRILGKTLPRSILMDMATRNSKNIFNKRSPLPCLFAHGAGTGREIADLLCRGEIASKLANNHCPLTIKFFDVDNVMRRLILYSPQMMRRIKCCLRRIALICSMYIHQHKQWPNFNILILLSQLTYQVASLPTMKIIILDF